MPDESTGLEQDPPQGYESLRLATAVSRLYTLETEYPGPCPAWVPETRRFLEDVLRGRTTPEADE